jgi:conjugative transfer signal peptidase TraF
MNVRRVAIAVWGLAAVLSAAGQLARAAGVAINHTASAPRGLWRIEPLTGAVERGQWVSVCPPDEPWFGRARERGWLAPGRCPGGFEPLLKQVGAAPGDILSVGAWGVEVNGRPLPNSAPLVVERGGVRLDPFPAGSYAVEEGEVWLISTYSPASLDSRYFGPMARAQIVGAARPLWTETEMEERQ